MRRNGRLRSGFLNLRFPAPGGQADIPNERRKEPSHEGSNQGSRVCRQCCVFLNMYRVKALVAWTRRREAQQYAQNGCLSVESPHPRQGGVLPGSAGRATVRTPVMPLGQKHFVVARAFPRRDGTNFTRSSLPTARSAELYLLTIHVELPTYNHRKLETPMIHRPFRRIKSLRSFFCAICAGHDSLVRKTDAPNPLASPPRA